MSRRSIWPEDQIRAAIAPALADGEARIRFNTLTDAERFRYACYTLRRRKGIGAQLSFILQVLPSDNKDEDSKIEILIKRTPLFEFRRIEEVAS